MQTLSLKRLACPSRSSGPSLSLIMTLPCSDIYYIRYLLVYIIICFPLECMGRNTALFTAIFPGPTTGPEKVHIERMNR